MKVEWKNKEELKGEFELAGWLALASSGKDEKVNPFKVAKHCIRSGHGTPTRAMRFVFKITGISRVTTHELVRHEVGFYKVQRSQRYVKEDNFESVIPPKIRTNKKMLKKFKSKLSDLQDFYNEMLEEDIKAEDARYILPNAVCSEVRCSLNWEALCNFMRRRRCHRAQWEIRALADEIYRQVSAQLKELGAGDLIKYLGLPCIQDGRCREEYSCGFYDKWSKKKIAGQ